jgi:hypothetical protein
MEVGLAADNSLGNVLKLKGKNAPILNQKSFIALVPRKKSFIVHDLRIILIPTFSIIQILFFQLQPKFSAPRHSP